LETEYVISLFCGLIVHPLHRHVTTIRKDVSKSVYGTDLRNIILLW